MLLNVLVVPYLLLDVCIYTPSKHYYFKQQHVLKNSNFFNIFFNRFLTRKKKVLKLRNYGLFQDKI
jgi:hypothetical protein